MYENNGNPPQPLPDPSLKQSSSNRLVVFVLLLCCLLVVAVGAVAVVVVGGTSKSVDATDREVEYRYIPGPEVQHVQFSMEYTCHQTGKNSYLELVSVIPATIDRRQEVSVSFDPQPSAIFDDGETRYARFVLDDPAGDTSIVISGNATIYKYDLDTARSMTRPAAVTGLDKYLAEEMFLEKDSKQVQEAAEDIEGEDDVKVVADIFEYIADEFAYGEYSVSNAGAATALSNEGGTCADYADAMVAICRAKGIPAKTAYGVMVDKSLQDDEFLQHLHMWVEVYLQRYGWVPFDPTAGEYGTEFFDKLYPFNLRFSDVRNDFNLGYDAYYRCFEIGDPIESTWEYEFIISESDNV